MKLKGFPKLPRGLGVSRGVDGKGRSQIRVRLGGSFIGKGRKAQYRTFNDEEEAKEFVLGEIDKKGPVIGVTSIKAKIGEVAFALDGGQLAGAGYNAAVRCRDGGVSLEEAVDYSLKCKEAGISLAKAVGFALERLPSNKGLATDEGKTFADVAEFVLGLKAKGLSAKHIKDTKNKFKRMSDFFGRKKIGDFDRNDFKAFLSFREKQWLAEQKDRNEKRTEDGKPLLKIVEMSATTTTGYARHANMVFVRAKKEGWIQKNPLADEPKSTNTEGNVTTLTPAKLVKIFAALMTHRFQARTKTKGVWDTYPATIMIPGVAAKAFSGLRTSEALRLYCKSMGRQSKRVFVPVDAVKTETARSFEMEPNLLEWLNEFLDKPDKKLIPLTEDNWHKRLAEIEEVSGIEIPDNALRHSFGSYFYHREHDIGKASAVLGSAADTVKNWYVSHEILTEEINWYFSITPRIVRLYVAGKFDLETFKEIGQGNSQKKPIARKAKK